MRQTGKWHIRKIAHRIVSCAAAVCLSASVSGAGGTRSANAQGDTASATGISVQASEQIFVTLCALDAAGFNANQSTLGDLPDRIALRNQLLKMQSPAVLAVRSYYQGHPDADPDALLSRYVTFGLTIGPPPDFNFALNEDELPPEALALQEFQPLLAGFYKEADIEPEWRKVAPEYDVLSGNYRTLLRGIVVKTNAYLREVVGPQAGRAFTVYVEPLAGSHVSFRNLGDHYVVVAGEHPSESTEEIQHAYLHYILDPLVLKDRDKLQAKTALFDIAARAPQLPQEDRADLVSFIDENVVKAVELRLRNLSATDRDAVLTMDDQTGFIMVRPLLAELKKFEGDTPSMTYYLPELVGDVDVAAETARLRNVRFTAPPVANANASTPNSPDQAKEDLLAQGDRQIALGEGAGAAETFKKALIASPDDPHALYGLAVASLLTGQAEESKSLFERIVSQTGGGAKPPDPSILSWAHVYLGRLNDLEGERDVALKEYQAVLAVDGAPEAARVAAQKGLEQAYAPPSRARSSDTQ